MGIFRTVRGKLRGNWCGDCDLEMEPVFRRLYGLPTMTVGHYVIHSEPEYFKKHLVPVEKKAEIPTGMYACGIIAYRCPQCGRRVAKLSVFLPVRDIEKEEQTLYFERGEMDDFLWGLDRVEGKIAPKRPKDMDGKSVIYGPRF